MLWTILDTSPDTHSSTLTTHQLFRLVDLSFLLSSNAIFHATEVRSLTFEALVIRQFVHSPLLHVVVVVIIRIAQSLIFVYPFMLCSFHCSLNDIFLDVLSFLQFFVK